MFRALTAVALSGLLLLSAAPVLAAGDYQQVVDLTFPVEGKVSYSDDYADARGGGRAHRATDIVGQKGAKVYAAVGGQITWIPGADGEPEPAYGYMISIRADDGRTYHYVHLDNDTAGSDDGVGGAERAYAPGLREGSRVERGQWIGRVGDSGNAEAAHAHLHFEIDDPSVTDPYGTHRINPYPSLLDAEARGDYGGQAGGDDEVTQPPSETVERLAGSDRIGTALALSRDSFSSAHHVVLAPAYAYADAIVAGPLAAVVGGPVLTTGPDRLDSRVAEELRRLDARHVTLVGGAAVLSGQVARDVVDQTAVPAAGVRRLAGVDAFETAAIVANTVWAEGDGRQRAVVALGRHPDPDRAWPDALTSGWLGAATTTPVLLVDVEAVPPVIADALRDVPSATIVGGTAAIGDDVTAELDALAGEVTRRAGTTRYGTAVAVAEAVGANAERVWAATGRTWADAIAAAPAVARAGQVFVLLDGVAEGGDVATADWLRSRAEQIAAARVLGGTAAVSEEAVALLAERITGGGG